VKKEEQQNRLKRLAASRSKPKLGAKTETKTGKAARRSSGGGPRPKTLARGKDTTFSNQEGLVDPRDLSPANPNPLFNGPPLVRGIH